MTREETEDLMAMVFTAFPGKDFTEATVDTWWHLLADLPAGPVLEATRTVLRSSRFIPTVAEIRLEAVETALALPSPEQAWETVSLWLGAEDYRLPPGLLKRTVMAMGGRASMRQADNLPALRRQFLELYNGLRAAKLKPYVSGKEALPMPVLAPMLGAGQALHVVADSMLALEID